MTLEESVPQTGAPEAWAAGFDGTGSTIAVLDTGIDLNHPDVAGQVVASQDFTGKGNVLDGHGHGTHVAATAAGTGDASDGLRPGVAPGADLVIGKVMGDDGSGSFSAIIGGMEWAAGLDGVDVINMSLGGYASDGTDPMSLALNRLTEQNGVLFVVSAGNDGPGSRTISYPATAEAALAVGAVDRDGDLASFSSRGPRLGDWGIKPEITAPGVGIRAARAAGTSMGSPLNDLYTAANGTSMAAPHVSGAAAIVRQQHPDWDPATVKAALVNSATPHEDLTPYEQGGGELDVAQAVQSDLTTSPSVLNMGYFEYPHDDTTPVEKTLTYTNHGDQSVSVNVQATLTDDGGTPIPDGMIVVEPSTVEVAAGATADVTVTLDRALGQAGGVYFGSIDATADGERLAGTPVAFIMDEQMYDLIIDGVQRDGQPAHAASTVSVLDAVTMPNFGKSAVPFLGGRALVRVPPGTYSVVANFMEYNESTIAGQTMMGDLEVVVDGDTHLSFDAREATPVTIDQPYDDAEVYDHQIQYRRASSKTGIFTHTWAGGDWPYYVAPTEPVTLGTFSFGTKFDMAGEDVSLHLAYPEPGAIPADPAYEVTDDNTATFDAAIHADSDDLYSARSVTARFPWESQGLANFHYFDAPLERTEVYSANEVAYRESIIAKAALGPSLTELARTYQPGHQGEKSWFASPNTPSLREGTASTPSDLPYRLDNTLRVLIPEWGDASPGESVHYGNWSPTIDQVAFRMFEDGELYAYGPRAFGSIPLETESSRIRFELDVDRNAEWWTTSTSTRTAWEFDSARTTEAEPLPLLQIDYNLDLDLNNTAPHPRDLRGPYTIGLDVRMPYGVPATEVEQVSAWLSYDEGQTWKKRPVKATADGYEMTAPGRGQGTHASLKIKATDADGNGVEQQVINAYKLP